MLLFFLKNSVFIIYPAIALFFSIFLTKYLIYIFPKLSLVDRPGEGKIHNTPVPTSGGLAIIVAFFATSILYLCLHKIDLSIKVRILIPIFLLILCGLIDDKYEIRARYKLILQLTCGAITWFCGIKFSSLFGFQLPVFFSFLITVIWLTIFINAFNLIDGLDGLAAGLGFVSTLSMAAIFIIHKDLTYTIFIISLGAACLGFLKYNFHPAKIFLGDTGSMFIGYMIGSIGIISSYKLETISAVLAPILVAGIPLFDVFLAVWRRIIKRILTNRLIDNSSLAKDLASRDQNHLHHRILRKLKNHKKTTLYLYFCAIICCVLAISLTLFDGNYGENIVFIITFLVILSVVKRLATWELWNSTQAIANGLKKPQKTVLILSFQPLIDVCLIFSSYAITYYFFLSNYSGYISHNFYIMTGYNTVFPLLFLNFSRVYKTYWWRSCSADYYYITEKIFLGCLTSFVIGLLLNNFTNFNLFLAQQIMFTLMCFMVIVGERMTLRVLRQVFVRNIRLAALSPEEAKKVLVYGGGLNSRFYFAYENSDIEKSPVKIIGIIDDEKALVEQFVYGYKVLGSIENIEAVFAKYKFDHVVITSNNISEQRKNILKAFCKKHNIPISSVEFVQNNFS